MKLTRLFISLAIGLSMSSLIVACNTHCKNKDCKCNPCSGDSCRCDTMGIDSSDTGETMVNRALIYLDNSESMKGYSADILGYTNVLTQLSHYKKNTEVLLCCNNYEKLEGDVVDKVKNLKYGGSSLLHNDLQAMVSRVSDNNIIFFVTDGIMSGTDTNIKKDKQWTKMHAADLKLKVKEIFSSHKDVAVSAYQFPAQFNGKYFCFDNSNVLINAQRYFYVFAIGKKDAVLEFKNKNVGTDYFKPSNQLHFIDQLPLSEGVNVKNSKRVAGVWNFDLKEINNKKDDPKMMIVTVKSDQFNAELNENQIEDLYSKFRVNVGGKNVLANDIIYDPNNRNYVIKFNPGLCGKKFNIDIEVPFTLPGWVALSSCSDDLYMKQKSQIDNKTFLLQELIGGITQGKLGDNELLYKTSITVMRNQ